MVDEEDFPADLGIAEETRLDQGVQPRRCGLTQDVASVGDRVDATVGLLEQYGQGLCVPSTRRGSASSLGDVLLTRTSSRRRARPSAMAAIFRVVEVADSRTTASM